MARTVLYLSAVGEISGAERSLLAMLDALDRAQWQPVVAAPAGPLLEAVAARGVRAIPAPLQAIVHPRSPGHGWALLRGVRRGRAALRQVIADIHPQLIHANTTSAMLYVPPSARLPLVWHVRDLVPLGLLGRLLYRRASCVAVISRAVAADIMRYADDGGDKVTVVSPAVDTKQFHPLLEKTAVRAHLGVPRDVPLIGLVAQFVPWKRHQLLLDALALLGDRPWHLVLAGAQLHAEEAYLDTLRARIDRAPLAGRITLLPWQPDVAPLLGALDLCALTSHDEPFGRVLIEAMACGVPVVAIDEGGARDIVVSGETGLLLPADPRALATGIAGLLNDARLRADYGAAGRARVQALFSLSQQRQRLTALYQALIPRG